MIEDHTHQQEEKGIGDQINDGLGSFGEKGVKDIRFDMFTVQQYVPTAYDGIGSENVAGNLVGPDCRRVKNVP